MSAKIVSLVCFDFIGDIQTVNFFQILAVTITQGSQLVVSLAFLRLEACVGVLADLLFVLDTLDVDVAICNELPLTVKLCVQFSILTFTVVVNRPLFVNFGPKSLNEPDIGVDSGLVVLIHAAFVFIEATEVLL